MAAARLEGKNALDAAAWAFEFGFMEKRLLSQERAFVTCPTPRRKEVL
jgi:hypothetical protein